MSEATDRIDDLERRFANQLDRARSLIKQFDALYADAGGRGAPTTSQADVLRGGVVLLHAVLEDLARTAEEVYLPHLGRVDVLDGVGFPVGGPKVTEKMTLGALRDRFPNATVAEVVSAAVQSRCERSSYNDVGQFLRAFRDAGVTLDIGPHRSALASLMARRHLIAHRGDWMEYDAGDAGRRVRPLARRRVAFWADQVESVGIVALAALRRTLTDLDHAHLS